MSANSVIEVTPLLSFVFWVEAIVYLSIGVYELLDDFFVKSPAWMHTGGRLNSYLAIRDKVGHKMHGGLCFVLGYVALNGILEGHVSRMEMELTFISLAILISTILVVMVPGRLGAIVVTTKPEFWLQIIMFVGFWQTVRPVVLALCIFLNVWGLIVMFRVTRRKTLHPFTYEQLREDMVAIDLDPKDLAKMDKMAGYSVAASQGSAPVP